MSGDMGFVGPRPERPEFVQTLIKNIPYYNERHNVKPGLTGWAQLKYPYGATEEDSLEKLKYDLYYVKNHSFFMDVLIVIQTVEVVLLFLFSVLFTLYRYVRINLYMHCYIILLCCLLIYCSRTL